MSQLVTKAFLTVTSHFLAVTFYSRKKSITVFLEIISIQY